MTHEATSMSVLAEAEPHAGHRGHARGWKGFFGHYVEMVVAMMPGCAVGCVLWGLFLKTWADTSGLTTIGMALLMAATMGAWMRYRRHLWSSVVEMSASMFVAPGRADTAAVAGSGLLTHHSQRHDAGHAARHAGGHALPPEELYGLAHVTEGTLPGEVGTTGTWRAARL